MSFELKRYLNLLDERKLDEALKYRKKNIPKKLYKYVSLSSGFTCNKEQVLCYKDSKLNKDKLECLRNNKIWLSRFNNLNDPFEYKCTYIDYDKLTVKGCNADLYDNYFEGMRNLYLISSFTTNIVDNMPMWAHYSNNHQGFCVEYDVINAKLMYPIAYENERVGIASILTNIFNKTNQLYQGAISENDEEYQFYMTLVTHFATVKHESWKYEKEYRLLYADNYVKDNFGMCIPSLKVGLIAKKVFAGYKCSEENKKRIAEIAKELKIEAYEMHLDDKEYKLKSRLI